MDTRMLDPIKVAPAQYRLISENERARMLDVTIKPGEISPLHWHPDHVVYVISGSRLRLVSENGEAKEVDIRPGQVLWVPEGAHTAENIGTSEVRNFVVELK